jgi:hypothetical protein
VHTPKPFIVFQPNVAKPLFTVYAYTLASARLIVAATVAGKIRMMCQSPKSRAGCHFAAAIGLRAQLEGYAPEIPDWVNDQQTLAGRKLGRALDHFRNEGAKLVPPRTQPTGPGRSSSGASSHALIEVGCDSVGSSGGMRCTRSNPRTSCRSHVVGTAA